MFKSITFDYITNNYHLIDTEFEVFLPLPYIEVGYYYRLPHSGATAPHLPLYISRVLVLYLEYQKRNADIPKNLALYYISAFSAVDRIRRLATAKLWFSQYAPELKFYNVSKCISNKMNQYVWINQIKS